MPDVVDGCLGLFRGHLGRWYGHTLPGTILLCGPGGLFLAWLLVMADERLLHLDLEERLRRVFSGNHGPPAPPAGSGPARYTFSKPVILSMWTGAFSHLFWDFFSHGGGLWLYPFPGSFRPFPSWWNASWFEIPLPFYVQPYPFGPHLISWIVLTILGAWLFIKPFLGERPRPGGAG